MGFLLAARGLALAQPAIAQVFVNELHYDNTGADIGEGVEVAGPAGTDLTGWSIVFYDGMGGVLYATQMLSGSIPGQVAGFGTKDFPMAGIQNGSPDGLALVSPSNVVVQFLSYEGTFTATNGPSSGLTSVDIGVTESTSTPVGQSLQLQGTGCNPSDFIWTGPLAASFGGVNVGQTFGDATPPAVSPPAPTSVTQTLCS